LRNYLCGDIEYIVLVLLPPLQGILHLVQPVQSENNRSYVVYISYSC
jgi:hypothetical protein